MGKDVGGEGTRRGEGSQISAGRAYTTEIDIEILGLDRPTIHQDVFAADASGPAISRGVDRGRFPSCCECVGE